jgi:hypothetical protein
MPVAEPRPLPGRLPKKPGRNNRPKPAGGSLLRRLVHAESYGAEGRKFHGGAANQPRSAWMKSANAPMPAMVRTWFHIVQRCR